MEGQLVFVKFHTHTTGAAEEEEFRFFSIISRHNQNDLIIHGPHSSHSHILLYEYILIHILLYESILIHILLPAVALLCL